MKVEIVTTESIIFSEVCESVSLPSTTGTIEVRYGHEPMILELCKGEISLNKQVIECTSGNMIIDNDICRILITQS